MATTKTGRARKGSAATTRLRKVSCTSCGCVVRMSRAWIIRGLPTCACGAEMSCPDIDDAALIDDTALSTIHEAAGRFDYRSYRESRKAHRPRCFHSSCSRFRKVGSLYCSVHEEAPF